MKIVLPSVELICVDGRVEPEAQEASVRAINRSIEFVEFSSVKLFSPREPSDTRRIQWVPIAEMNKVEDYSRFVLKSLHEHVTTEHALIIQWDGYVINPQKWENEFLKYDYIGAPWPDEWAQSRINRVGNGGFSLRSRKLMSEVAKLGIPEERIRLEDNLICLTSYNLLTADGFKFAPPEIAARFSWENPIREIEPNQSFGFHGRHVANEKYLK